MLMYVLRAMLGGHVAVKRINAYFNSEDAEDGYTLDSTIKDAISVDASFTWEANIDAAVKLDDTEVDQVKEPNPVSVGSLPLSRSDAIVEPVEHITPGPFILNNIEMEVPRGAFVAIGEVNGCISDVLVIELLHSWSHWFGEEQCMSFLVLHKCMF
jgi:hypothetical protein